MKNLFKKNNDIKEVKGNTLIEVIVSIIVVGIIVILLINIFVSTQRTNANLVKSEQMVTECSNILTLFTSNANESDFISNLDSYGYKCVKISDTYYVYFTKSFFRSSEVTNNYITFTLTDEGNYTKIDLIAYYENVASSLEFSKEVLK